MKVPEIFKDRKAREKIKDKIELVMAVVVITGAIYKKVKGPEEDHDEEETE